MHMILIWENDWYFFLTLKETLSWLQPKSFFKCPKGMHVVLICENDQYFFPFSCSFFSEKQRLLLVWQKHWHSTQKVFNCKSDLFLPFSYSFFSKSNDHHQFGSIKTERKRRGGSPYLQEWTIFLFLFLFIFFQAINDHHKFAKKKTERLLT